MIEIKNKTITTNEDWCRVECSIGTKILYIEFPKIYEDYISDDYDACLLAALPDAMRKKEDIKIRGTISYKLYHNICNYAMNIISIMLPECEPIKIEADSFYYDKKHKNDFNGTGISCGVDSFVNIQDFYFNECGNYKLTHLFNLQSDNNMTDLAFQKRLINAKDFVSNTTMKLLEVRSNVSDIISFGHPRIHWFRNISIVLFFQKMISKYYYASAWTYLDSKIHENCLHPDPILIPLLSTENIEFISHGCQYTRVEKTEKIMHTDLVKTHLDVCVNHKYVNESSKKLNCGKCSKCQRTMLVLDFYNLLEEYDNAFDQIRYFKKHKNRIFKKLDKSDPLSLEIINLYSKK
jgi:hypothetical protein